MPNATLPAIHERHSNECFALYGRLQKGGDQITVFHVFTLSYQWFKVVIERQLAVEWSWGGLLQNTLFAGNFHVLLNLHPLRLNASCRWLKIWNGPLFP